MFKIFSRILIFEPFIFYGYFLKYPLRYLVFFYISFFDISVKSKYIFPYFDYYLYVYNNIIDLSLKNKQTI